MIFAELRYPGTYDELHEELRAFLSASFSSIQSGHQGDSWFWIFDAGEKVAMTRSLR